jgi:hypothetical protein
MLTNLRNKYESAFQSSRPPRQSLQIFFIEINVAAIQCQYPFFFEKIRSLSDFPICLIYFRRVKK